MICLNLLIILSFILLIVISGTTQKTKKNILVNVFPGGRSHNFVLKELFEYSKQNENKYEYIYHVLVHNVDKDVWPENSHYKIYSYGSIEKFGVVFNEALELVRKEPVWGYSNFNKAMVFICEEFMKSGVLNELRKVKFDMSMSDIPNFIHKFLVEELDIKLNTYVCPPSLPNLFWDLFEFNPSYLPAIGATFTDVMTFKERFINSIFVFGTKVVFKLFRGEQSSVFRKYGYDISDDVFVRNSLIMIQYPYGLFFNVAFPPNFVRLNAVTPKPANPITDKTLDVFLSRHKKNIYFSQGTIVKIVDFDRVMGLFEHFKDYGFILAFKQAWVKEELRNKFPKNVLLTGWVPQNDLLADKRLNAFITHGGCNSVAEALYHFKPIIALGVTIDQINTASAIKKKGVGVVIHDALNIDSAKLIPALEELLHPENNNTYIANAKKYGNILRNNRNPRQVYHEWIDYGFELGYEHLLVQAYSKYNFIQLYNYDVLLVWIIIFYLIFLLFKKIFVLIFCSCKTQKLIKHKTE